MNFRGWGLKAFWAIVFVVGVSQLTSAGPYVMETVVNNYAELTGYGGTGADGAVTLGGLNGPNNPYYTDNSRTYLTAAASAGVASLTVASSTGLSANDEVLIIDMLGATTGIYEIRKISSVSGTTINLTSALTYTHPTYVAGSSLTQVLRVPQYTTVTLNSGAYMTAHAFNGQTGGVLFFRASTGITINYNATYSGRITVDGKGYPGGAGNAVGSGPGGGALITGGLNTTPGSSFARMIMGSGGGGGVGTGGAGGGILMIKTSGDIAIDGNIMANGAAAPTANSGGGGAGGTIAISANTISRTQANCGPITASGGAGSSGGGSAGSGGRIFLGTRVSISTNCTNATPNAAYPKFIVK